MHANWATILGLTQPAGAAAPEAGGGGSETTATEGAPAGGGPPGPFGPCGGQGGMTTIIMMLAMFAIFYFLLIRPQSKKAKEHQNMLASLQKGDEVVTGGGIIGRISGFTDKLVTLEISEKVRVRVLKAQIFDKFKG
jgi:preprotein translocase subunit YajC